jgi:hypothetical protein
MEVAMAPDEQVPGIVSLAVLLATAALGPDFALAVGAYGAIMLGWFGGVMVGVWRMPPVSRGHLVAFVVASLVATLGITVPTAQVLTSVLSSMVPAAAVVQPTGLLLPVAFLLPAIGHSWVDVARWVWSLRRRAEPRRNEGDSP